jgi:hypothetical protein
VDLFEDDGLAVDVEPDARVAFEGGLVLQSTVCGFLYFCGGSPWVVTGGGDRGCVARRRQPPRGSS